jgi:hypothetical protein
MGTFILIAVVTATILLGRYALIEGQRIEQRKKFHNNIENFDKCCGEGCCNHKNKNKK